MTNNSNTPAILLLNIPAGALCGINLLSFTTSPRFHGIKLLSAGFHFVFTGATTSQSVRHGVWFHINAPSSAPPDLIIKKWDVEKEELVPETDQATLFYWKANLGSIWNEGLTPYRQSATTSTDVEEAKPVEEKDHDWHHLTNCITSSLLTRITNGHPNNWTLTSASSAKQDVDEIPGLTPTDASADAQQELHFLPINLKQTWREGAIGRERTDAAQDRSWALGDLLLKHCPPGQYQGEREVVGEMQFTFLMVLTVANYSCLEQWKRILGLVLTCKDAVQERAGFFVKILRILRLQLQHCEDVEGDLSDEGGGLLKGLLMRFRRAVHDGSGEGEKAVREELEELEDYVRVQLGWELSDSYVRKGILELEDGEQVEMEMNDLEGEDERGEYAPVVVDLAGGAQGGDMTN